MSATLQSPAESTAADDRGRRLLLVLSIATATSVVALFLLPPVGFVACMVLLVLVPPWGRSLTERTVISLLVILGSVAVVFPRAGATPVTQTSARLALAVLVIGVLALRLVPRLRTVPIPRPTWVDGAVALLAAGAAWWLMAVYVGRNAYELVSGLFFSGWDNRGHFTAFSNTYVVGSTTWPTIDGTTAWNQWYPNVHATTWALAELASRAVSAPLDRIGLLWPFIQWNAISFALCLAVLAWVGADVASRFGRLAGGGVPRWVPVAAVGAFAVFGLLGSPQYLYNRGFTNFMMAVTVVTSTAWLSARSWTSARVLGWFLIPLSLLAVIGLWTPLALGLVPVGVVVAIALLRWRLWVGVAWLVGIVAMGAWLGLTQTQAVIGAEEGTSAGDFAEGLGQVGIGMSPFNIGAGLMAPLVVIAFAILLIRRRNVPAAIAVLGPTLGALVVAIVFMVVADSVAVGRLQSYYVLKSLNAMLIMVAPLIAALVAVALGRALRGQSRTTVAVGALLAAFIAVALVGYVGAYPVLQSDTFVAAPGIQAAVDRTRGVDDPLIGESIVMGAEAAAPYPDDTPLLWDGSGTLPNLWVATLTGVVSTQQNAFYGRLPAFPYDEKTEQYVDLALNLNPSLRVAVLWFREPSGAMLEEWASGRSDDRVTLVQVPMGTNAMCPECPL